MPTPGVGGAFSAAGEKPEGRYGSVTRTETLINEQKQQSTQCSIQSFLKRLDKELLANPPKEKPVFSRPLDLSCPIGLDVFCDWLTIYQDHDLRDENDEPIRLVSSQSSSC